MFLNIALFDIKIIDTALDLTSSCIFSIYFPSKFVYKVIKLEKVWSRVVLEHHSGKQVLCHWDTVPTL